MVAGGYAAALAVPLCDIILKIGDFVTFTHEVIMLYFNLLWFECISQSIVKKFLPVMYHMLNYSYSQFVCNPSTHSQII